MLTYEAFRHMLLTFVSIVDFSQFLLKLFLRTSFLLIIHRFRVSKYSILKIFTSLDLAKSLSDIFVESDLKLNLFTPSPPQKKIYIYIFINIILFDYSAKVFLKAITQTQLANTCRRKSDSDYHHAFSASQGIFIGEVISTNYQI